MKRVAVVATVVLGASGLAAPAQAAPLDPSGGLKFDFGTATSPVADGYLRVADIMLYTSERGYGFDRRPAVRDRGAPDALRRDFTTGQYSFAVDLPNGDYHVSVLSGDQIAPNSTTVAAEGVPRGTALAPTASFVVLGFGIRLTDGQLNLDLGQDGRVNALEITPVAVPTGLRLVSRAPVELAWTPSAASYRVYRDGVLLSAVESPSYVDHTAALGDTYDYSVSQVTDAGLESAPSDALRVAVYDETVPAPAAPKDAALVAATTSSVELTWRSVRGAVEYQVHRGESADGPFTKRATVAGPGWTDPTPPATHYFYRVYAVGLGGRSVASATVAAPVTVRAWRQAERLDRGLVAVPAGGGTLVSWRLLASDPQSVRFALYRDGRRIAVLPGTNYLDPEHGATYQVAPIVGGREGARTAAVTPWAANHLDIPLDRPADGVTPVGGAYTYHANDASLGDLDGDGRYEIVLKWDPSNSKDNSQGGYTGEVILDAYTLDGVRLWRVNLGRNIRAGAHYTQFLVYDFDGDGRSEVVVKTADGTVDGQGTVIGDPTVDHRTSYGRPMGGTEFFTVFDGRTGAALATTEYVPQRGDASAWGDSSGNRSDRFLASVAYLDGVRPSIVMARGYYTRSVLAAFDWRDGRLSQRWVFDSEAPGNYGYSGQGNHNMSVGDVDGDGRDEITYGAMAVDDDGTGIYTTRLGHGDAMHLSDLDPARPGLEVFDVHENTSAAYGLEMRDARTGETIWGQRTGKDTGRGTSADIDPGHLGAEAWAVGGEFDSSTGWLYTAGGQLLGNRIPAANFAIWWDGDLQREILDHTWDAAAGRGVGTIGKWDPAAASTANLLTATGTLSNNGTKGNPSLQADLIGDWREEVLWRTEDSSALRLYATAAPTGHRFVTLMQDPIYRLGVAWQNSGYNQPPHTSFYLGGGMAAAPAPDARTGPALVASATLLGGALAVVELPVDAGRVAVETVRLFANGSLIPARGLHAAVGDRLWLIFDRAAVEAALEGYDGKVAVTLTGHLLDGRSFQATTEIRASLKSP
jgi:fibronectin type 3 domain-containing protein